MTTKFKVGDRVVVGSNAWFKPRGARTATVIRVAPWSYDGRWFIYIELDEPCAKGGRRFYPDEGWACRPEDLRLVGSGATPTFTKVGRLIKVERKRQDDKFGPKGNLAGMARQERLSVLMEEVGELAKDINDLAHNPWAPKRAELLANMKEELVQVAAVAVAWLEVLEEYGVQG